MWFNNKRDEGIIFQEYFKPIPIASIALILTAVSGLSSINLVIFLLLFAD
jgi:Domain of unknown function (DUF6532)